MSRQIIKQPNGKYCVFSTIVDNIVYYNMGADDVIKEMLEKETRRITDQVNEIISDLEAGKKPYFQFTKNYEEMIEFIKEIHGKRESNKVRKTIEGL